MGFEFDEDAKEALRKAFASFDKDGSGFVEKDELADLLRAFGLNPTKDEIDSIMKELDTDQSGGISFDEYMACVQGIVSALKDEMEGGKGPEDKMRDAFKTFDADGSGYLEREEFKRVLTQMGKDRLTEEQFEALMQDVDTDEDGRVNVEEFIAMSTKGMTWLKG